MQNLLNQPHDAHHLPAQNLLNQPHAAHHQPAQVATQSDLLSQPNTVHYQPAQFATQSDLLSQPQAVHYQPAQVATQSDQLSQPNTEHYQPAQIAIQSNLLNQPQAAHHQVMTQSNLLHQPHATHHQHAQVVTQSNLLDQPHAVHHQVATSSGLPRQPTASATALNKFADFVRFESSFLFNKMPGDTLKTAFGSLKNAFFEDSSEDYSCLAPLLSMVSDQPLQHITEDLHVPTKMTDTICRSQQPVLSQVQPTGNGCHPVFTYDHQTQQARKTYHEDIFDHAAHQVHSTDGAVYQENQSTHAVHQVHRTESTGYQENPPPHAEHQTLHTDGAGYQENPPPHAEHQVHHNDGYQEMHKSLQQQQQIDPKLKECADVWEQLPRSWSETHQAYVIEEHAIHLIMPYFIKLLSREKILEDKLREEKASHAHRMEKARENFEKEMYDFQEDKFELFCKVSEERDSVIKELNATKKILQMEMEEGKNELIEAFNFRQQVWKLLTGQDDDPYVSEETILTYMMQSKISYRQRCLENIIPCTPPDDELTEVVIHSPMDSKTSCQPGLLHQEHEENSQKSAAPKRTSSLPCLLQAANKQSELTENDLRQPQSAPPELGGYAKSQQLFVYPQSVQCTPTGQVQPSSGIYLYTTPECPWKGYGGGPL